MTERAAASSSDLADAARADDAPRHGVPRTIAWLGLGAMALVACLIGFGALAEDIHDQEAVFLDNVANPYLHGLASPALDAIMGAATFLGSAPTIPILLAVAVIVLWLAHHRPAALFLLLAIGGSLAINQALKLVFHRPRPQLAWATAPPEYSFPSGHAQNGLVFYVALALIVWVVLGRRAGIVAVVAAVALALLIGTSRIYFGYHYLSDVIGGDAAGLAWLLVVGLAFDAGPMLVRWRRRGESRTRALQARAAPGP